MSGTAVLTGIAGFAIGAFLGWLVTGLMVLHYTRGFVLVPEDDVNTLD